jgi:hypothetical protein
MLFSLDKSFCWVYEKICIQIFEDKNKENWKSMEENFILKKRMKIVRKFKSNNKGKSMQTSGVHFCNTEFSITFHFSYWCLDNG